MAESGAQAQVAASGPGMWRRERKEQSESRGSILKSKRFDIKWYGEWKVGTAAYRYRERIPLQDGRDGGRSATMILNY